MPSHAMSSCGTAQHATLRQAMSTYGTVRHVKLRHSATRQATPSPHMVHHAVSTYSTAKHNTQHGTACTTRHSTPRQAPAWYANPCQPTIQHGTTYHSTPSHIDVSVCRSQEGRLKHRRELSLTSKIMQISLLEMLTPCPKNSRVPWAATVKDFCLIGSDGSAFRFQ